MSNRTRYIVTLVKLAVAAAVSVVLFIIVISAMKSR